MADEARRSYTFSQLCSRRNAVALFSIASVILLSVVIGHGETLRKPDDEARSISNLGVADEQWAKVFAALLGVLGFFAAYAYYRVISAPQNTVAYVLATVAAAGIVVFQTCVGSISTKDHEQAHYVVAAFCFGFYIFAGAAAFATNRARLQRQGTKDVLCTGSATSARERALAWLGVLAPVIEIAFLAPFIDDPRDYFWGEYVCTYVALLPPLLYLDKLSTQEWFRAAPPPTSSTATHGVELPERLLLRL